MLLSIVAPFLSASIRGRDSVKKWTVTINLALFSDGKYS
jgi:hypothetical protein